MKTVRAMLIGGPYDGRKLTTAADLIEIRVPQLATTNPFAISNQAPTFKVLRYVRHRPDAMTPDDGYVRYFYEPERT